MNSVERDFFKTLNTKITRIPDENFDKRFWNEFEAEFEREKKVRLSLWERLRLRLPGIRLPLALGSAAALLVGLSIWFQTSTVNQRIAVLEVGEILENEDLYADLDLFIEMEDAFELTEQEWEILLEQEG